ncbi:hypothetical protein M0R45_020827 [Rubus argutus]|uniref:Uncharacterized protein n=1 Tax=Rubus argutus TaxID=59490 RepID=A0AAW1XBE8_RUBAR
MAATTAAPQPSTTTLSNFPTRRTKSKLTKDQINKKIKADNIPITKTPITKTLKLMDSYDAFLADKQIVPLFPRLLGK